MRGGEDAPDRTRRRAARPRVVRPEGDVAVGGPRRVTLRPSVEVFTASDGITYILEGSGTARFVIRTGMTLERCLLQSLDGRSLTLAELRGRLARAGIE